MCIWQWNFAIWINGFRKYPFLQVFNNWTLGKTIKIMKCFEDGSTSWSCGWCCKGRETPPAQNIVDVATFLWSGIFYCFSFFFFFFFCVNVVGLRVGVVSFIIFCFLFMFCVIGCVVCFFCLLPSHLSKLYQWSFGCLTRLSFLKIIVLCCW